MSKDRAVHTDALETLGTIIDESAERDAIHLAVEPVIAGEDLMPGQHVGVEKGIASPRAAKMLGIVDPFLETTVRQGERFWLVVTPRTITSLRHVWSHPDFPEKVESMRKQRAIAWIEAFAEKIGTTFDEIMEGAKNHIESEGKEYLHMGDNETYSSHYDEMPEFWDCYEAITGVRSKHGEGGFFSCSC